MSIKDIHLGSSYYCLLKTSKVSADSEDEFLYHIAYGVCRARGIMLDGDSKPVVYVEIANQKVRATHTFKDAQSCVDLSKSLVAEAKEKLETEAKRKLELEKAAQAVQKTT